MADHGRDKAKKASIDFLLEALINRSSHPPSGVKLAIHNGDNLRGQKPKSEVLQVNLLVRLPVDLLQLPLDIVKHTSYPFGSHWYLSPSNRYSTCCATFVVSPIFRS